MQKTEHIAVRALLRAMACWILGVLGIICATHGSCAAQRAASADDVQPPRTATVLAALIGEDVSTDNVAVVHQYGQSKTNGERYRYLLNWVVLAAPDRSIRMRADFRETFPAAGQVTTRSTLICPAMELVEVAAAAGRLSELRDHVAKATANTNSQKRSKAAIQFLIDVALNDLLAAGQAIERLCELSDQRVDFSDDGFPPEAVAVWIGLRTPSARASVDKLVSQIYAQQLLNSSRSGNRAHLNHMVSNFGLQRHIKNDGTADTYFKPPALENWASFHVGNAKSNAIGLPEANWGWDGKRLHVRSSYGHDILCYRVPLTGNFEAACEFTSNSLSDLHFMYGAEHVTLSPSHRQARLGSLRHHFYRDLTPSLRNQGRKLFCRIVVRDGLCSNYINGRLVRERQLAANDDPWLTLRATSALRQPSIGRIQISGTPVVPKRVDLCGSRLSSWWSHMTMLIGDTWSYVEDERGNGLDAPMQPHLNGTHNENVLRYYRPLAEDGDLTYEFFYEPGKTHVHPVLGRIAFLLHPDGIKRHRFTNGRSDRTAADPSATASLNGASPIAVPL